MSWQVASLCTIYPLIFGISIAIIGLLSRWIVTAHSFIVHINEKENLFVHVKYPVDVYLTFVLAGISLLLAVAVFIPNISRKRNFQTGLLFFNALLSLVWLFDSLIIVTRAENGSMIDKYFVNKNLLRYALGSIDDINDKKLDEISNLGTLVMILAWVEFFLMALTIVIKLSEKRKDWENEEDTDPNSFGCHMGYDKDARELNIDGTGEQTSSYSKVQGTENSKNSAKIDPEKAVGDGEYAIARYSFRNQEDNDFSFKVGDRIRIIRKSRKANDWWLGEVNGKIGEFPANYVKLE
ncbi:hypothetical protein G9A89_010623 [Geosiphon pyriformis]|nr:hypothetical protein G9A89_010623 [Geosiphon pyriformis]